MNSKRNKRLKKDMNYLIDCDLNQTKDMKSDKLRSKMIHLNAIKDQFNSQTAFDEKRLEVMTQLNEEMDKSVGKNTFLSEELIEWSKKESTERSIADFESYLFNLSEQQICDKLDLKKDIEYSDDCQVIGIVLKKSEDIEIIGNNSNDNKMIKTNASSSDNYKSSGVNCNQNKPNTSLFNKLGSFSNGFPKPQILPKETNNYPKTFISREQIEKSSKQRPDESVDEMEISEIPPKRKFMTGFEKKVVEDVKKGSIGLKAAKNVLLNGKNSFKPPIKDDPFCAANEDKEIDPNLKNIDKHLIKSIESEIITKLDPIKWDDVSGLDFAKKKIREIAILPLLKPHYFTGIRKPSKGILLFGPPGTGKTFLGRLVASITKSTFFSITVSSLNSKWIGEGEKTIKALFAVARSRQPSVIFIDEIDSLLTSRCDSEHESSRRMKTEFLAQFEGVNTSSDDKILIIGATNRPQDLDDAARRRLTSRLYIRLPDLMARKQMITNSLKNENHFLSDEHIQTLAEKTDGYSGADMRELCRESAMEVIRDLNESEEELSDTSMRDIRDITFDDFIKNLNKVKPTVRQKDLEQYEEWNTMFGINDGE